MSTEYGILLVEGRDGRRCGTASGSPPTSTGRRATASPSPGGFPTILLHTPTTRPTSRYSEIADFFTPRGYAVVLQDMRDRYRSEGVGRLLPRGHRRTRARTATTPSSGSPRSRGRTAASARSAARTPAITQVRTALERPPHLTAIWPDVVPTNSFQNQSPRGRRDAAAHVLGALHPRAGRAGYRRRPGQGRPRSGATSATCGSCFAGHTVGARTDLAPARAAARADADRLLHPRHLRRVLAADRERLHAVLGPPCGHPGTFSTGWYDPFPAADTEYFAAMARAEHGSAAARDRAVEPCRHARRRDVLPRRRLRARQRRGACSATSRSSSPSSPAGCPTTRPGSLTARRRCASS